MATNIVLLTFGRDMILGYYLGTQAGPTGFHLHLYASNIDPTQDDNGTALAAAEATYSGYASQAIGSWTEIGIVAERATWTAPTLLFLVAASPSAGNDIYGYYVTEDGGGNVVWAQKFDGGPFSMNVFGDAISVVPTLTNRSEFAAS